MLSYRSKSISGPQAVSQQVLKVVEVVEVAPQGCGLAKSLEGSQENALIFLTAKKSNLSVSHDTIIGAGSPCTKLVHWADM